jgi:hypothetical protein
MSNAFQVAIQNSNIQSFNLTATRCVIITAKDKE